MPFGLLNVPASFQGYINKIFSKILDVFMIVYLDNIIMYTDKPGQAHIDIMCSVLDSSQNIALMLT